MLAGGSVSVPDATSVTTALAGTLDESLARRVAAWPTSRAAHSARESSEPLVVVRAVFPLRSTPASGEHRAEARALYEGAGTSLGRTVG